MKKFLSLVVFLFCTNIVFAEKYIFFLHNRFLEEQAIDDLHPEYGKCEYDNIVAGFRKEGFIVISEIRKKNTGGRDYARKVVVQIDSLMKHGVMPSDITVIGTSKGGYIAQYVSTYLAKNEVNYVFIGCCQKEDVTEMPEIKYTGNILSIYERTDVLGTSCKFMQSQAGTKGRFKEIELNTAMKHGFLYKALPVWMEPAVKWAKREY
jgi:hypothetical protein